MGFRFRKSIKLPGGVKVNVSKSGVGFSWGFKGFRISQTATGKIRITISIPGTGISYDWTLGSKKRGKKPTMDKAPSKPEEVLRAADCGDVSEESPEIV